METTELVKEVLVYSVLPTFKIPLLNKFGSLSWISQTSLSLPTFCGVI